MKLVLGDNQFFGINHSNLKKGEETKSKFADPQSIVSFIHSSLELGLDGFMMNSNDVGFQIVRDFEFDEKKEIHYSLPYPHKYASMVNEGGMLSLLGHLVENTSFLGNVAAGMKLASTRNLKNLVGLAIDLEVPNSLPEGSNVYLQNVITDLLLGLGRVDVLEEFADIVWRRGYRPGLITLNPLKLNTFISSCGPKAWLGDLVVCFNINQIGFNVFPSLSEVETLINSKPPYKLMGMSVFASGGSEIKGSIDYVSKLPLDYVVFGSSRLENIANNYDMFQSQLKGLNKSGDLAKTL